MPAPHKYPRTGPEYMENKLYYLRQLVDRILDPYGGFSCGARRAAKMFKEELAVNEFERKQ